MNSKKIMAILLVLLVVLVCLFYYMFANRNIKAIDFNEENLTEVNREVKQYKKPEIKVVKSTTNKAKKEEKINSKEAVKETKKTNNPTNELYDEYKKLLAQSKRDRSLGEPRYNFYVLNSQKLNAAQKRLINDIRTTLSLRGGYLKYEIFVEKISDENMKLYIFNTSLFDNTSWEKLDANALPNMLFKFNQDTVLSIKNSFYMRDLKLSIGKNAKIKAMHISGHTDENGSKAYNYALGLKRSAAVASEFLRQVGKITLDSYGKDAPFGVKSYENRCAAIVFM